MTICISEARRGSWSRRDEILAGLAPPAAAREALIVTEDERRAFETDALTAYRRMPLAVVLPDHDRGGRGRR